MIVPRGMAIPALCGRTSCSICELADVSPFAKEVYHACARLPAGAVMTYGGLAAAIRRPGAARAVGSALARNVLNSDKVLPRVPCHRVVRGDGAMGGFNGGGCDRKREMLQKEGVVFREDGTIGPGLLSELAGKWPFE